MVSEVVEVVEVEVEVVEEVYMAEAHVVAVTFF